MTEVIPKFHKEFYGAEGKYLPLFGSKVHKIILWLGFQL